MARGRCQDVLASGSLVCLISGWASVAGFVAGHAPDFWCTRPVSSTYVATRPQAASQGKSRPASASGLALLATLGVGSCMARRSPLCRKTSSWFKRKAASPVACAAGKEPEGSQLEREAAKLRAEAKALEEAQAKERRMVRARQLAEGRAGGISADVLAAKLKEVMGLSLSVDEVQELVSKCSLGKDSLELEDLASVMFDAELSKLVSAQDSKLTAELAARKQQLAEEAEREKTISNITGLFAADPGADQDGIPGRLLACLPYLLPLIDGIPYGGSLADVLPFILPLYAICQPLLALKSVIPFGTFVFLIGFQYLCRNPDLPSLLRYNLRQACVIDIFILLPQFIAGFVGIQLPGVDVPIFILMALSVGYSVLLTALGKTPNGLGFISDATDRGL